jgi:hypothetical protein
VSGTGEPTAYATQRLRDALAADERVAELGLEVEVAPGRVTVRGQVPTPERRQAVAAVVADVLPGYRLDNATTVADLGGEPAVEELP